MAEGFLRLYQQLGLDITREGPEEAQAKCPFHKDDTASFSLNLNSGLFKCFAASCGKAGTFEKFQEYLAEINLELTVDPKIVEEHHTQLLGQPDAIKYLHDRGITDDTISRYQLGHEPGRVWIPITDDHGRYVNARRHAIGPDRLGKTLSYKLGFGTVRLWPPASLKASEIWIAEGELDCLLLLQQGFSAITTTGGAGTWKSKWNLGFANKHVKIVYDMDEAGVKGAYAVAEQLYKVTKSVKVLKLPFAKVDRDHKDITDWFIRLGKDRDELIILEGQTEPWEPAGGAPVVDDSQHVVELYQASEQAMVGKRVKMKVMVAGKDLAPFTAPREVTFTCRMGLRTCASCSIARQNGRLSMEISKEDPGLLKLINMPDAMQKVNIRKLAGIVETCPRFDMQVTSFQNLEELKLLPDLEYTPDVDTEYVIRQGYFVGDGIRTNQPYEAEGRVIPHPANQYVTFLLPKMTPTKSSIQEYKPDITTLDRLSIFQPRNPDDIMSRWKDIAADLTYNVTRIYQREDLIYAVDLTMHSVLAFTFQEQPVQRSWAEGLIVGDTRCGKSETLKHLIRHYKMGEIITGENVSFAGLVGGLQQTQKRWSITWGKIPLNDRRCLVIDEVSGMSLEDISRMSGIRSSGIAEISKIQTERTLARARLIWSSNPRSARPLNTYDSGAQVIRELIGKPEDIARFDYCMMVSSSDVPLEVINQRLGLKVSHKFTSALCHELLLWGWSRTRDQVHFTPEATEACLDYASQFAKLYSAELPLVEPNEQRIKFARLAASVACRMFSTEDGETLKILPGHVKVVADLLQRWYNNTNFNYRFYSEQKLKEIDLTEEDKLVVKNTIYPYGIRFCQALLAHSYLRLVDIEDLTGRERKDARLILGTLVQCGAVKRRSLGYVKSPGFIRLLRETKAEDVPRQVEI